MTEIVLENLSKHFNGAKAVDNLNMTIKDKEFVVLLGPSGCGKTTTLRLIVGLEKPTGGKIYFDGKVVNELEPKERNVAMVFQEYALYPHMTVFDNMALCLKVDKVPKDKIAKRVKEIASILQIEELLCRKPSELSGGQQQRVALGRAIVRNPSVYLMDEPLSNLDAILRVNMRAGLKKLHEKLKTTTVYVTHDQAEAMVMADRVAVLKDGKLLQLDKPHRIYTHPKNKFVAEFVGSPKINFIDVELSEEGGRLFLEADSFSLPISENTWADMEKGVLNSKLVLGIRPEHVLVCKDKIKGCIESKVYFYQDMGHIAYLNLEIGPDIITAAVDPNLRVEVGEKVFVKFDEKQIKLFDKSDEKAILH